MNSKHIHPKIVDDILGRFDWKHTDARCRAVQILADSSTPLSIADIRARMKSKKADITTIYRTLYALVEAKLARQVDFGRGEYYYELESGNDHHHLVCTNCHTVVDIECDIPEPTKKVLQQSKFDHIDTHALEFFGICQSCATIR